jgi:hypothetical protein
MDRQIFNMNCSVEATSLYIVVTSLVGDNQRPTLEAIRGRWTISTEALDLALEELMGRGILERYPGPEGELLFFPQPASLWR